MKKLLYSIKGKKGVDLKNVRENSKGPETIWDTKVIGSYYCTVLCAPRNKHPWTWPRNIL